MFVDALGEFACVDDADFGAAAVGGCGFECADVEVVGDADCELLVVDSEGGGDCVLPSVDDSGDECEVVLWACDVDQVEFCEEFSGFALCAEHCGSAESDSW